MSAFGTLFVITFLPLQIGAPWVKISEDALPSSDGDVITPPGFFWVNLETHQYLPASGSYDSTVVGNLVGAEKVLPLWAARNRALVAPISLGTPGQDLSCMLDATSSDIWLPSVRCASCAVDAKEKKGFFRSTESKTFSPHQSVTLFGLGPQLVRIVDSGGFAEGFIVNETVKFGNVEVEHQPLLLAEEASQEARADRAWDGVCGIGRREPSTGGPAFYTQMVRKGLPDGFVIAGKGQEKKLAVGVESSILSEYGYFSWAAAPAASSEIPPGARGGWSFEATAHVGGLINHPVRLQVETGTSFLLVPRKHYLSVVRSLLPNGAFDKYCGLDSKAGNVVICDCQAKNALIDEVSFEFLGLDGQRHPLFFRAEDLFDEAPTAKDHWLAKSSGLCVLQVQQRPDSAEFESPFGVLGKPFLAQGASSSPHGPFPGSHFGSSPFPGLGLLPLMPGPVMPGRNPSVAPGTRLLPPPGEAGSPDELEKELDGAINSVAGALKEAETELEKGSKSDENGLGGLLGAVLQGLGQMEGPDSVVTETVSEYLGNGERCNTEIVRAANGTVLETKTWLMGTDGSKMVPNGPVCDQTTGAAAKKLDKAVEIDIPLFGGGLFATPPTFQGRKLDVGGQELWVIGGLLLKRYTVAFDFGRNAIGFSSTSGLGALKEHIAEEATEADVEALTDSSVGAIQKFEAPGKSLVEADMGRVSSLLFVLLLVMGLGAIAGVASRIGLPPCNEPKRSELGSEIDTVPLTLELGETSE